MNDERLKIYEKWKRYIGCGNPKAKIWIIGIEEGGAVKVLEGQSIDDAVADYFDNTLNDFKNTSTKELGEIYFQVDDDLTNSKLDQPSPVWTGIFKITQKLFPDPSLYLIRSNSDIFISNIYPLGNKSLKNWEYEGIGLPKKQYAQDMANIRPELFQILLKDKIVIFHGKGHWHEAYKMLGVNENDFEVGDFNGKKCPWLRIHQSEKIIFTRHFANGMPNVLLDEISRIVKEWMGSDISNN